MIKCYYTQVNNKNADLTSMTITEKYIKKIIPYLCAGENEEVETVLVNGLYSYKFACPWCSMFVNNPEYRAKKCASLVPIQGSYDYKFICMRSGSQECRRKHGGRSFYNFLAMYNPSLFIKYRDELATLRA